MKTGQEQIEEIEKVLKDSVADYKQLKKKGACYCYAETLVAYGYGDVSEYKAEIERLQNKMNDIRRDTAEEFAKRICEMLWNVTVDKEGNRFSYGDLTSENVLYIAKQFGVDIDDRICKENSIATAHINKLIEQDAEIQRLKAETEHFESNMKAVLEIEKKQAQIDVLNKVKEEVYPFLQAEMYNKKHFIISDHINDKLLENQNIGILKAQDVLSKWFNVKIDELINEVQNAEDKG